MKQKLTGIISKGFGRNFTGSADSPLTVARKAAVTDIIQQASQTDISVDDFITAILVDHNSELQWYVKQNKEIPVADPIGLAAQAALLRAEEVATVAKALDLNDDDALSQLESAEYDAFQQHIPDVCILSTPVDAALYLALCDLKDKTGGTLSDFIGQVKGMQGANGYDMNAGGFIGGFTNDKKTYNNADGDDPGDPGSGGFGFTNPFEVDTQPTDPSDPASNPGSSSGGFSWSSIGQLFSGITNTLNGVKSTAGTTTGFLNGLLNNIKGTASSVGSSAIQDALMKKLPLILLGILIVAVIVILIARYANKRQ